MGETASFGELLRELRGLSGLTQEELAERAGVSVRGLSDIERGLIAYPRRDTAEMIAGALPLDAPAKEAFLASARRPVRGAPAPQPALAVDIAEPTVRDGRIPVPVTPLLGRARELAFARAALTGETRLLTITGPGGVGKTRISLTIAADLAPDFEGRVWFVELAPVRHASLVLSAIAHAMSVSDAEGPPDEAVADAIGPTCCLLVLDNLEHLLPAAVDLGRLLAACPELRMLVTSRAPLHLRAEQELPLDPLSVAGTPGETPEAVALFVERARAARPAFDPSDTELRAVQEVCRRLDGLPLAIELAAARIRQMPPAALLSRLERRLPILTGGAVDLPARQQTLRNTIEWSYALLAPEAQRLFRLLAVFAGGAAVEQVAVVAQTGDACLLLDELLNLCEHSLLRQAGEATDPAENRFLMLETIREYGLEQLEQAGELGDVKRRHSMAMADVVARLEAAPGEEQQGWLNRLDEDRDNARVAFDTAADDGEWTHALAIATGMWRYWEARGRLREGYELLEQAVSHAVDAPADLRARALNNLGNLANDTGDPEAAARFYEASLVIRRELGDPRPIAASLNNLGLLAANQGEFVRARPLLEESLAIRTQLGDEARIAHALASLGNLALHEGHGDEARALFEQALTLNEKRDNASGIAYGWWHLGEVERLAGSEAEATVWLRKSLQLFRALDLRLGIAAALSSLGEIAVRTGDHPLARGYLGEALALWREIEESRCADCLAGTAAIIAAEGSPELALRLLASATALRERTHAPAPPSVRQRETALKAELEDRLDPTRAAVAWVLGRSMPVGAAIDEATAALSI